MLILYSFYTQREKQNICFETTVGFWNFASRYKDGLVAIYLIIYLIKLLTQFDIFKCLLLKKFCIPIPFFFF